MNRKQITKEQALEAIHNGEFGGEVTGSSGTVVVLMTQDWCSHWARMKQWIYALDDDFDLYELIYDLTDYFNEFRIFKETVWNNASIPYLRYYRGGAFSSESNYLSREEFLKKLK